MVAPATAAASVAAAAASSVVTDDDDDDEDILRNALCNTIEGRNKLRWILTSTCDKTIKINDTTMVVVLDSFSIVSAVLLAAFSDETSPAMKHFFSL